MAREKPEVVKELSRKLSNYLRSVDAQRPLFVPPANQLPGRTKYKKSMKRNLSLLLCVPAFCGTALAQEHNPGSVQPDTIQKSSENLSGNNALHE